MSAITILNKGNVPTGPFTRAQVAEKLQGGEFTLDSLAFVEGLTQWTPLRDVLARVDAAPSFGAPPPAAAPAYSYAATMQPPGHLVYAGFWLRVAAYLVDYIILHVPMTIIAMVIGGIYGFDFARSHPGEKLGFLNSDGTLNGSFITLEAGTSTVALIVGWLYFSLQESSFAQATLGKRVIGLKVTDEQGQRIGFGRATGRFFGKIISGLILCIGYMMAGFTERKQALHDMLAGTLVVRG
ncbi:MAG: RDD family protein [Methylacidiphilales bacterium]|nr:RDD family protein [Candidatus Methylacidiphilales bacterium]